MMNKIVAFLEKHVQWIALGLGALYLGYMIWAYLVQTPVLVTGVAAKPLTPGEVDPFIQELAVQLDAAMKTPTVPEMVVPNFIDAFKSDMDFSNFTVFTMRTIYPDSPVLPIQLTPTPTAVTYEDPPMKGLPTPPPATMLDIYSTGKSNIQVPVPGAPANGAPPAPAPPVQPVAGNAAVPAAGTKDLSWVTVGYAIPHQALAQAFTAAKVPVWTEHTSILQVQVFREESLPGGQWSKPTLIAPLSTVSILSMPAGNNQADQQAFLVWAQAHISDILQPAFYQVNKGDAWSAPGVVTAVVAPVLAPLDPSQDYPPEVLSQYPTDQKLAYIRAHIKFKRDQSSPNGGRGAPPAQPGALNQANPRPGSIGIDVYADVVPPPAVPNAPAAPNLAAHFPIPAGDFDPNSLTADITGWAHDDTVVAGHTYRYSVSYTIKNPIWKTSAAKNNPPLRDVFALQSAPSDWSKPINVASTTNFFIAANSRPGAPARIKVYKWENGVERSHIFDVAPGDIIGGKDADVDYATGWTLVDLRFDDPKNPGSMTVLVIDPNGNLDRRDYKTDQQKPELKALEQQVSTTPGTDQLAGGRAQP